MHILATNVSFPSTQSQLGQFQQWSWNTCEYSLKEWVLGIKFFFFSMIGLIGDISAGCQGMWYKPLLGGVTIPWSSRLIRKWCSVQGKWFQKGPLWKLRGLLWNGFKGAVRTKNHIVHGTFKVNASKTTQREHDGKPYKHSCLTLQLCTLCVVSEAWRSFILAFYGLTQIDYFSKKSFVCVCMKKERHIHLERHEGE